MTKLRKIVTHQGQMITDKNSKIFRTILFIIFYLLNDLIKLISPQSLIPKH